MTDKEIDNLKPGHTVKVLGRVEKTSLVEEELYTLDVSGNRVILTRKDLKKRCDYIKRKFRYGDLVRLQGYNYIVAKNEDSEGQIVLTPSAVDGIDGGLIVNADEVYLLMPAEEIEKLTEWKGGSDA